MRKNLREYCIENVYTDKETMRLSKENIKALCRKANKSQKKPLMVLSFEDGAKTLRLSCEIERV